jgi:BASS family bile acid:Na+ symporter
VSQRLTSLFPLLAVIASVLAWQQPHWFNQFGSWIVPTLALIMFAMGLTLSKADFARVMNRKSAVALGVTIQFTVMPLIAFLLARILGLSNELVIGMVLVGSASGGTASNVICYLARADVALSISMTLVSTLVAVIALPFLSWLYLGQVVPVPVSGMFVSVLKIVLAPLLIGIALNHFARATVDRLIPCLPIVTTAAIIFIIAIIVALNHEKLAAISTLLVAAVVLHNSIGLFAGYAFAKLLKQDELSCRTIAIEVGMQNSGLAVALAVKYFSPLAALPGALFSVWHNVSGSVLATIWSRKVH